ncbi:zinc finger protein 142 isoform X1 [Salmo salar]|uniref:Zinc finger protein 142 isoform X1 n=2 Tax=Salmo salar TaxID=8030 RepID=A0A1S3NWH6_SALSA|nr:zinc finger protein 142 isoform X1 [Salmo salar]
MTNEPMETEGLCLCEKCGKEFSDSSRLSSHLCTVDFTKKGQLTRYKCPLCDEVFTMPGALKHHFQSHRREELTGPFHCSEEGCQFSTSHRLVYQEHLHSQHALTLVSCTFRSCTLAFRTRSEMEGHWRIHMPFHCPRCDFVTAHAKQLSTHGVEHDRPLAAPEGDKEPTTIGQGGSSQSALETSSGRPRRARKRNPAYVSSSQEDDEDEEETQQHNIDNRAREEVQKDKAATNINENPSKDHIMAGMEHMYRTHICPECRRCFKMRSHLLEHLHLHFPDPSLQCPTCNHYFTSKSKLRIHMLRESGQKVHRCHLCDYASVERNSLHRHLASVHSNEVGGDIHPEIYPCPTCGQSFRQSQALKAHMKSHHTSRDSQPLACFQEGCSFKTSDRKELQRHAADVHAVKAVECRHHACNAIFGSPQDMEAHYRTHLAFHCSQCDFSCSNKNLFRQHKLQGHAGDVELTCNFCPFATFNPVEFQQHVGHFHANEKIHRCHQCSFVTAHKRVLRRHMLMHSGEKPHKCNLCDFRCRDETYLSKHILIHSDDKNHMCSECGYVTKWKHYLNVHMRKHAGDLRYQCDQCSYRCHRTDQLNSHKLRHQAKSLICEVCAYSCKRKYELRKHMLLKHSQGEGHQPPVFQCKYCPYQTCYRQALHNHENCKHTRTREFRCALCPYSTYSSTGLFIHKRKAHGYVPGDKEWQENYAEKERENSVDLLQGFYKMPAKNSAEGPIKNLQEKVAGSAVQNEHNLETVTGPKTPEMANKNSDTVQVVVDKGILACHNSTDNPEQCCTLVLTTIANTECTELASMQGETPNSRDPTYRRPTADPKGSNTLSQKPASASEAEEEDMAMEDCDDLNDSEDRETPLTATRQQAEAAENNTQIVEVSSAASNSSAEPLAQSTDSEIRLKAMRKQDKDQAEALVLEGRVQMLVVQNEAGEASIYRCEHCSYVTRKQTSLRHHCHSLCLARWKRLKCQACGAQFKQKRGLDTHRLRKCPALQKNTRRFIGTPSAGQFGERDSGQGKSQNPDKTTTTDQSEIVSCDVAPTEDSIDTQPEMRGEEANLCDLTNPEGSGARGSTALQKSQRKKVGKTKRQVKVGKIKRPVKIKKINEGKILMDKAHPVNTENDNAHSYIEDDMKFTCKTCSFRSSRLVTIERHCSTCTRKAPTKKAVRIVSSLEQDDDSNEEDENISSGSEEDVVEIKVSNPSYFPKFSCPNCLFRCKQKRALNNHEKRGCLKLDEVQCEFCSFVAKSQKAMANHVLVHRKDKLSLLKKVKKAVLRCDHCPFTCKQERCMTQHVALKHEGAKPHRCRFCPFSTTRRYRLYAHESLHTGMGRHSCDVCDQTFGAASKLRQHHKRVHDKQPSHFCTLCDFSSYSFNDVGRHTLRCHTGKLLHPCSQCEARFSSDTALKQHCSRKHLSPASVACQQCDFICGSQATLKVHQQRKHPQLDCATCHETFPTRKSLEEHQRTHLTQQCPLCPFATRKRQPLTQHLLDEHEDGPPEDKPLKCAICGFACRHQLVFEQHVRSHGGTRLYKCTDCQYSTRNKQKITWHIRIHTGEKPYHCEQCSYSCVDPSRLKYHMRIHQEEKKYLCPECGYKCKWMSQLKYHMTKHTGDKPYACDECEYRTNRGDALRIHRETQHCDARTFICEKCGKGFKTRFLLKTHQRKHSEERPYVCGLCRRAFRWPAGLRHHYLTHTNQQPFMCRYCPYRAKQKFQVVKHLRGHHPDQPVEQGVAKDPHALSLTLQDARLGGLEEGAGEEVEEGAGEEGMEVIVPDGVEVLVHERVEVLVQERVEEVTEGQQGEE